MTCTELTESARRSIRALALVGIALQVLAGSAIAQAPPPAPPPMPTGRFVMGPLTWTPTLALREAGVDSNVFNTATDPKEDITSAFGPSVDSTLALGVGRLETQGQAEYLYFERYTDQRAINGRVAGRLLFPVTRIRPILTGRWARAKERSGNELEVRVPRTEYGYGTGLGMTLTSGSTLDVTVGRDEMRYDKGVLFHGVDVGIRLDRRSTTADLAFRANLTPLTKLVVSAAGARDEFIHDSSRSTDNVRGVVGLEFASDAVITGRATVGYHRMVPRGSDKTMAFQGLTSAVDLNYALLGRTLFKARIARDTTYSVLEGRPFYLSTAGSLEIIHNLVGPIDLDVRGIREKMDYSATANGLPARIDYADTFGAGFVIRASEQTHIGVYFDDQMRDSSESSLVSYRRKHLYTTITYGF